MKKVAINRTDSLQVEKERHKTLRCMSMRIIQGYFLGDLAGRCSNNIKVVLRDKVCEGVRDASQTVSQ